MPSRSLVSVRAAIVLALGAGSGIVSASAGETESLHAPYVRLDPSGIATLTVRDESRQGALVRAQLIDRDGHALSYGDHPITISRAVPPGETIEIDLLRFWSKAYDGSLTLSASQPVTAALRLSETTRYSLVHARAGAQRIPVGGRARAHAFLAVCARGEVGPDVRILRVQGGERATIDRVDIAAFGSELVPLPGDLTAGDVIRLESDSPIAVVLFEGDTPTALEAVGTAVPVD